MISLPLTMSANLGKEYVKRFNNPEKKYFLGRSRAKIGWRKLRQILITRGEIPVDVDRQKQRLRH